VFSAIADLFHSPQNQPLPIALVSIVGATLESMDDAVSGGLRANERKAAT